MDAGNIRISTLPPLAAVFLFLSACGPYVVHDTELRPVSDPTRLAAVGEDGWLAIDSTESGVRAVLELHLETAEGAARPLALHTPKLHCAAEGTHFPTKVRRETPICWMPSGEAAGCPPGPGDPSRCAGPRGGARKCLHVIRAEFYFRHLPALDDRVYFTFGQEATAARWAVRER